MEKLIYGLADEPGTEALSVEALSAAALAHTTGPLTLLVPDQSEVIRARNATRIFGDFDRLRGVVSAWLPSLDDRAPLEEALAAHCSALWGYLVTESVVAPCPHAVEDGARVPGITQLGCNDKPKDVALPDFYRAWQEHSQLSFDLHPRRESYERNAVARRLTPEAPSQLAIVLERFGDIEDYVDDRRYFGDKRVVQEMLDHLPQFFEGSTAFSGGMSEYRFRAPRAQPRRG